MAWQASAELDNQAELYYRQRLVDLFDARERSKEKIGNDVIKRNIAGSGIHYQLLLEEWEQLVRAHFEGVMSDLIALVERHEGLSDESAEWIQRKFEAHVDALSKGMARTLDDVSARWRSGVRPSLPGWERAAASVKGRAKLRLDTAVGEARLSNRRRETAPETAKKGSGHDEELESGGGRAIAVPHAFFCHADSDAAVAEPLARDLRQAGVDVWYDAWEIKPGDSLRRKIDAGIDAATHFLVLLTPASLKSEWVQTELDAGMVKRISGNCRLIPILSGISGDEVPATLRGLVWVQLNPYAEGLRKLIDACYEVSQKPPLGPAPVRMQERPLAELGLSADAQRIAAWINGHSELGVVYDYFERDTLMNELGLSAEQAGMAASELSDSGYVELQVDSGSGPAGFSQLVPTPELFIKTDPFLRGWDPERDAVELAAAMVNRARDGVAVLADVDKHVGWGPRRLNPAADFLRVYGVVRASEAAGSSPYTYSYAFVDHRTRRFALAGSSEGA